MIDDCLHFLDPSCKASRRLPLLHRCPRLGWCYERMALKAVADGVGTVVTRVSPEGRKGSASQVPWRVYKRLIHAHGLLGHCMESLVPMVALARVAFACDARALAPPCAMRLARLRAPQHAEIAIGD
jgi:hypothetical protein